MVRNLFVVSVERRIEYASVVDLNIEADSEEEACSLALKYAPDVDVDMWEGLYSEFEPEESYVIGGAEEFDPENFPQDYDATAYNLDDE